MKKIGIIFTFFVFAFSIILSGFSDTQTKDTNVTNQIMVTQTTKNQHDCATVENTKDCKNACDTKECTCINHSCTGTISLFNLAENYQIVTLPDNNVFSSDIEHKLHDINYHIIHPPQA